MYYTTIKKRCDKLGLSIRELEKQAGIGNGTVGRWDVASPRVDQLSKAAKVLGVSTMTLVREAEIMAEMNKHDKLGKAD